MIGHLGRDRPLRLTSSGMLAQADGSTGGIDWGSLPSWVAALVAVVVGWYTIRNVRLVRTAYIEGKELTKVAQARLVYSRLPQLQRIEKGEPYTKVGTASFAGPSGTVDLLDDQGHPFLNASTQLMCFTLEVINNSKEPIGDVLVEVLDGQTGEPFDYAALPLGPVGPESSESGTVCTPNVWGNSLQMLVRVHFQDSAGNRWVRVGTEPVQEDRPKE